MALALILAAPTIVAGAGGNGRGDEVRSDTAGEHARNAAAGERAGAAAQASGQSSAASASASVSSESAAAQAGGQSSTSSSASASRASATFDYLIGVPPLCDLDPSACPDIAVAPNGDTVEITGSGSLSVHPKSVSGGGTFTHKDPDGNVIGGGTWTATDLISFHPYGSGEAQGLPSNFWGGQAIIRVHLVAGPVEADGWMTVDCELGKVPGGAAEGTTLDVPGLIHFNDPVSGFTVFVNTTP